MEQFEYTGKNMPVDIDLLVNHAVKLMKEYDDTMNNRNDRHLLKSPYADKIQMQVDANTTIEIPSEIQNQAIQKWISLKEGNEVKSIGSGVDNKDVQIKMNILGKDMEIRQLVKKEFEEMKKQNKHKKMKKNSANFGIIDFFFRLMIFVIITAMVIIAINFIKYGCNK